MAAITQAMAEDGLRLAETKTATARTARTSTMITTRATQSIAKIRISSLEQTSYRSVYAAGPAEAIRQPLRPESVQP